MCCQKLIICLGRSICYILRNLFMRMRISFKLIKPVARCYNLAVTNNIVCAHGNQYNNAVCILNLYRSFIPVNIISSHSSADRHNLKLSFVLKIKIIHNTGKSNSITVSNNSSALATIIPRCFPVFAKIRYSRPKCKVNLAVATRC